MKTIFKILILSSILPVYAEEAAPANPPDAGKDKDHERPPMDRQGPPGGGGFFDPARWKKADTNGDGLISLEEFKSLERIAKLPEDKQAAIFKRFDKNGDGSISMDEIREAMKGPAERIMPQLEKVDVNKDGKISFEEFIAIPFVAKLPEERQHKMFERMDRNKDGFLTKEDRPPREEHPGPPPLPELIKCGDTNGDGALSFEEFRAIPPFKDMGEDMQEKIFQHLDTNGDKKLDAADKPEDERRDHKDGDKDRDHHGDKDDDDDDKPKGPPPPPKDAPPPEAMEAKPLTAPKAE
jgi:Ca2+-binding EF-hand superfamily protein